MTKGTSRGLGPGLFIYKSFLKNIAGWPMPRASSPGTSTFESPRKSPSGTLTPKTQHLTPVMRNP